MFSSSGSHFPKPETNNPRGSFEARGSLVPSGALRLLLVRSSGPGIGPTVGALTLLRDNRYARAHDGLSDHRSGCVMCGGGDCEGHELETSWICSSPVYAEASTV